MGCSYAKTPQVHLTATYGGNAVLSGAKNCLAGSTTTLYCREYCATCNLRSSRRKSDSSPAQPGHPLSISTWFLGAGGDRSKASALGRSLLRNWSVALRSVSP